MPALTRCNRILRTPRRPQSQGSFRYVFGQPWGTPKATILDWGNEGARFRPGINSSPAFAHPFSALQSTSPPFTAAARNFAGCILLGGAFTIACESKQSKHISNNFWPLGCAGFDHDQLRSSRSPNYIWYLACKVKGGGQSVLTGLIAQLVKAYG